VEGQWGGQCFCTPQTFAFICENIVYNQELPRCGGARGARMWMWRLLWMLLWSVCCLDEVDESDDVLQIT
jgi:hypothetical protein